MREILIALIRKIQLTSYLKKVFYRLYQKPAPRVLIAVYLSLRWKALVSPRADIRFPFMLKIGKHSRIGDCKIICNGEIILGNHVNILDGAILNASEGTIIIGDETTINPYCVLYGAGGLTIGKNVGIATHTVIIPSNHGYQNLDVPMMKQPIVKTGIHIVDNVWIGAHCVILDGVTISAGAIVAAGAVVSHNVAGDDIVAGVPAKVVGNRRLKATT